METTETGSGAHQGDSGRPRLRGGRRGRRLSGLAGRAATARLEAATDGLQRFGAIILIVVGSYTMPLLSFGPGREVFVRTFLPFLQ